MSRIVTQLRYDRESNRRPLDRKFKAKSVVTTYSY